MGIVEFSLKRRVTVAMVAVAVSMFGGVAFTRLPKNLLPELSYPSLTVETRFPGAAPGEVEALLTRPLEEAVGVVTGVQRLSSVSRPGLSQVTLEFTWKRNMDFAALDVRQKLDLVTLPQEATKPVVLRFDPANDPVMRLYLTGVDDLFQLRYFGEEVVKKDLESTEGLAAVKVNGGYEEEIQVQVDEGKLSLLGLGIGEVRDRLGRENINQAGGSLYEEEARYLVRSRNEFEDLDDILGTVILADGGRLVTLGDVATVERGHKQRDVITASAAGRRWSWRSTRRATPIPSGWPGRSPRGWRRSARSSRKGSGSSPASISRVSSRRRSARCAPMLWWAVRSRSWCCSSSSRTCARR